MFLSAIAVIALSVVDTRAAIGIGVRVGVTMPSASGGAALTVSAISPVYGTYEAGITETLTGTGFGTAGTPLLTSVTLGGVACGSISVTNSTTATCVTGQGPSTNGGLANVVTNGGGSLPSGYCYLPPINSGATKGSWLDANFGTTIATGVSAWTDWSGNGNSFSQPTGALQMSLTANWLSSGKAAITSSGTQFINSTSTMSFTSAITLYQVRSDNGSTSKTFFQTDLTSHQDTIFTESQSATGTYGIVVVAGAAQNYGNTSGESRNAIHDYAFTFDNTVGAAEASAPYLDGTSVGYTPGTTPATSGGVFRTGTVQIFNDAAALIPTGSIAIQVIAQVKHSSAQIANAEKCFKLEYSALP